jgi:hypothetical protein
LRERERDRERERERETERERERERESALRSSADGGLGNKILLVKDDRKDTEEA